MLYLQALLSRGVLLILEACGSLEILKPRLFVTSFPLTLECLYKAQRPPINRLSHTSGLRLRLLQRKPPVKQVIVVEW